MTNPFIEARERLPSVVETLPRELTEANAARLLRIVEELKKSYVVELGPAQAVMRVDVEDRQAVRDLHQELEDYYQARLFDHERTHCTNIDRLAARLSPDARDRLDEVLYPLREADNIILDDVEQMLSATLDAAREIANATAVRDAEAAQARFTQEMEPRIDRLKATLKRMNVLANELVDLV